MCLTMERNLGALHAIIHISIVVDCIEVKSQIRVFFCLYVVFLVPDELISYIINTIELIEKTWILSIVCRKNNELSTKPRLTLSRIILRMILIFSSRIHKHNKVCMEM